MNRLTKVLFVATLATMLCAITAVPAGAQTSGRVRVAIPFDFSVGGVPLEAGDYTVQMLESGILLFTSDVGRVRRVAALTTYGRSANVSMKPHLVFTRYGKDVFLNQIFFFEDGEYNEVPASKLEKRLRRASMEQVSLLITPSR